MKKIFLFYVLALAFFVSNAQSDAPQNFILEKSVAATSVKNQAMTGTCWCFSTTSLVESQCISKGIGQVDISEMFSVRNIYIEKAKNYVLRQGHTQFGEGGLGHDLIRAIATYGAMPESVYSGLKENQKLHNHTNLAMNLQKYLDSILKLRPVPQNWIDAYISKLDQALGKPPADFTYQGKKYTPKTFAAEVLKFDADEYVNITSFTHHPFYESFILEVPDNFSNGAYYNLPLNEMIQLTKDAIRAGYSVMWDADVSNSGFESKLGTASFNDTSVKPLQKTNLRELSQEARQERNNNQVSDAGISQKKANRTTQDTTTKKNNGVTSSTTTQTPTSTGMVKEAKWDAHVRQALFENLTTQDDHLMHITGIERSGEGKTYFLVKNSWGDVGPEHGYINVSEAYFAVNTISLIIPKAALSKTLLEKLKIK